ncbi:dormancy-associated protein 1 [Quercus suber]|uniref:Dormancy-associated protein 1 n=1 Tax=Quercus suber TaxID=58331 RepID=A0AAW0KET2_QUESU
MVLLEKLWDDVLAGPQPDRGLGKLRKISTKPINIPAPDVDIGEGSKFQRSLSMPASPAIPVTPTTPASARSTVVRPRASIAEEVTGYRSRLALHVNSAFVLFCFVSQCWTCRFHSNVSTCPN